MAPEPACVVLVVEEDHDVCLVMQHLLATEGVHVIEVESGEEALSLLQWSGGRFAAVLVDVGLPGLDGPATIRAIGKMDPGLPCRLMTAGAFDYSDDELNHVSPWRLLNKAFANGELWAAVREMRRGDWPKQRTL